MSGIEDKVVVITSASRGIGQATGLLLAKRHGDADFVFLARDTALAAPKSDEGWLPCLDNRLPALHSLGGGGREYKAVYVQSDAEIGLFSDEVVVNCAP